MIVQVGNLEIDTARREVREEGSARPIQPQVFDLVELLVRNSDRVISKDEIIDKIWDGRIISEAALSSCIRLARQALNDDGTQQRVIKTLHGVGFRFVADHEVLHDKSSAIVADAGDNPPQPNSAENGGQPSIAILPFQLIGLDPAHSPIAEALPAELITTLSRLRWLKVLARGSTFQLRSSAEDPDQLLKSIGATYAVHGMVEVRGRNVSATVALSDVRSSAIVWSEQFGGHVDGLFEMREEIARTLVNSIELRIPQIEADRLRLTPTENLDAWERFHLGMRHMYRYSGADNGLAQHHLFAALEHDPGFARAHAALSYTEFQNHFQLFGDDPNYHKSLAVKHAEMAVELDPLDPFCALMLSRAKWLQGDVEEGLSWIERSLHLNPNSAFGLYNHALLNTVLCDGQTAAEKVENAISHSPIDPHLQSMLGTRAMAAYISDDMPAAQKFAEKSMRSPNAHLYVFAIAAVIYSHSGEHEKAAMALQHVRNRSKTFGSREFLEHYDLRDPERNSSLRKTLDKLGL